MTTAESNAYMQARRRFFGSPEVRRALESLRARAELERAKRAARRRKLVLGLFWVLLGALGAALVVVGATMLCFALTQ